MSPDELVVTIASVVIGPVLWSIWLILMARLQAVGGRGRSGVGIIGLALAASVAALLYVLNTWASFDVVDAPIYQFMYVVVGLAWLRLSTIAFPFVGLSLRDDAIERGNRAAAFAVAGALVGVTFCYAGGNIGDGPGWWVVIFAAALATGTLVVAWTLLTRITSVADAVTIDRDTAAGVRLGAWLAACGLVLGRGVAGDWFSAAETIADFMPALIPLVTLFVIGAIVERVARPTADRPRAPVVSFGVVPAMLYMAIAIGALYFARWAE
jgi:uncharacterized membrane protein YjfL (UPF0719 family)